MKRELHMIGSRNDVLELSLQPEDKREKLEVRPEEGLSRVTRLVSFVFYGSSRQWSRMKARYQVFTRL